MDCTKTGSLINRLRKEQKLTQKQLADKLNVSDKAVSKWERGLGCPDISILPVLAEVFSVNIEQLLCGSLDINAKDRGNMKKTSFFVCPSCGNIFTATGTGEISCCGRKLNALDTADSDSEHTFSTEVIENENYITFNHSMTKQHYIAFVAQVLYDRVTLVRMYPEQTPALRLPCTGKGDLYFYCSEHGLFKTKL